MFYKHLNMTESAHEIQSNQDSSLKNLGLGELKKNLQKKNRISDDLRIDSNFRYISSSSSDEKIMAQKNHTKKIGVYSEIGTLKKVFVHTPGLEVERMSPKNAAELLYNDIINYKSVVQGHSQLKSVLSMFCEVLEVSHYLADILKIPLAKETLIDQMVQLQNHPELKSELCELGSDELTQVLIAGLSLKRNTIESWLSSKTYSLLPLPNMYFMRDSSVVIGDRVLTTKMANSVRFPEAVIMRTIYDFHPDLQGSGILLDACKKTTETDFTIEGGDILVVNEHLLLVGISERTTPAAVDALIDALVLTRQADKIEENLNVFCVILPRERSTIHLDMIFSIVNKEQALVHAPNILGRQRCRIVRIRIHPNGEKKFTELDDLLLGLKSVGVRMDPIVCGGDNPLHQEREQWNSGANMFAFAPGKILSYDMHEHTVKACETAGFKIIRALDLIKNPNLFDKHHPTVVTLDGTELARGGGGPRCMTCPVLREPL
ncbi:MAG: hypothetical protein K2X39_09730 [Silvanigrellaceae bacterium]|nr:hypothetical protein [Silvanigrellaceae bacterium]